jgi:hypothetical protein
MPLRRLWTENVCYVTQKFVEEIKLELNNLFNDKQLFRHELSGTFISENCFLITPKEIFKFGKGNLNLPTRIQGKINKQNDRTILNVKVKPSIGTYPICIAFLISGLFILKYMIFNSGEANFNNIIVGIGFGFIIPSGIVFYQQNEKKYLKNKLEQTLKLTEQNCL